MMPVRERTNILPIFIGAKHPPALNGEGDFFVQFMNPKILLLDVFAVSLAPASTMALMGLALISLTFIRVPKNKK